MSVSGYLMTLSDCVMCECEWYEICKLDISKHDDSFKK